MKRILIITLLAAVTCSAFAEEMPKWAAGSLGIMNESGVIVDGRYQDPATRAEMGAAIHKNNIYNVETMVLTAAESLQMQINAQDEMLLGLSNTVEQLRMKLFALKALSASKPAPWLSGKVYAKQVADRVYTNENVWLGAEVTAKQRLLGLNTYGTIEASKISGGEDFMAVECGVNF